MACKHTIVAIGTGPEVGAATAMPVNTLNRETIMSMPQMYACLSQQRKQCLLVQTSALALMLLFVE
jgi:hypothetical protein